jgi:hypothetical protein
MSSRRIWIALAATLTAALALAGTAAAVPPAPWTGQWNIGSETISLVQTGSAITGTFAFCGGGTYGGTVSADGTIWTGNYTHAIGPTTCSATGQATFTATMAPDGRSFTASGATVGFGSPISFAGTYVGGGTEPRTTFRLSVNPRTASESVGQSLRLSVALLDQAGRVVSTAAGEGVTYTVAGPNAGTGAPVFALFAANGRAAITLNGAVLGTDTVTVGYRATPAAPPVTATATVTWLPNLASTIPNPRTVSAGPTSGTYPGKISVRSLKTSRCIRIVAVSRKAARVLVTIFSGRRSTRLFGQKDVLFVRPGRKVVCIPVPRRAKTFNVRTPLRFALGYRLGTTPATFGPRNPPVIRRIRLAP